MVTLDFKFHPRPPVALWGPVGVGVWWGVVGLRYMGISEENNEIKNSCFLTLQKVYSVFQNKGGFFILSIVVIS